MESPQEYITESGLHYKVMERNGMYCARYQPEGGFVWIRSNHVIKRYFFEEAQADLDRVAAERGWAIRIPVIKI